MLEVCFSAHPNIQYRTLILSCPKFFLLIRTDKAVEYFSYKESCVKLDKYININLVRIK